MPRRVLISYVQLPPVRKELAKVLQVEIRRRFRDSFDVLPQQWQCLRSR